MSTLFDSEERQELRESNDTEFTLSTASILGIFFGLVLICGVFFGFGYSIGRRSDDAKAAAAATTPSSADQLTVTVAKAKPSAVQTLQSQPVSAPLTAETNGSNSESSSQESASQAATPAITHPKPAAAVSESEQKPATVQKAALDTTSAPKAVVKTVSAPAAPPAPATTAAPVTASQSAGPSMVQIAAVSHKEDADVLIAALKKRGYDVIIRNEPQDKLLHVQVGPFATKAEAAVMKQKLLADGYNAIIK